MSRESDAVQAIIATFSEEERLSFEREMSRRLGKAPSSARNLTEARKGQIVRIIVEEVEMVLAARDA